jgi:tetratricopeptide (TPR) repeat protein
MPMWWILLLAVPPAYVEDLVERAAALEQQAAEQCRMGSYPAAERLQRQALDLWEQAAQMKALDLAPPHVNLAEIYLLAGKLRAAETHAEAARWLQDPSTAPPADRARVAALFARIRFQQERYQEAAEAQAGAVRLLEEQPAAPGALAVALNDSGMIQAAAGDLRAARTLLERAVQLYRQNGDNAAGACGEVLGNLALVCVRQGDGAAAEPLYRQAIEIVDSALGPAHPHLGMLLAEHSKLLKKLGRKTDARAAERRAKSILETSALPGRHTIDVRGRHSPGRRGQKPPGRLRRGHKPLSNIRFVCMLSTLE